MEYTFASDCASKISESAGSSILATSNADPSSSGRPVAIATTGCTSKLLTLIYNGDRRPIISTDALSRFTSSRASRSAVSYILLSKVSFLPPGSAICPLWAPPSLVRSIRTRCTCLPLGYNRISTPLWRASAAASTGSPLRDSGSILCCAVKPGRLTERRSLSR
ncbi:hypothetical protein D3C87_1637490 [compost metagenome]